MPRIWGEGPHEMYYHTPDGKWTHSGANRLSWDTLEEAKAHYHQSHTSETDSVGLFVLGLFIVLGVLAFI